MLLRCDISAVIFGNRFRTIGENVLSLAHPHAVAAPRSAEWWCGEHIHKKAFSGRFGFDDVRTSQLQTVSQKQSNGNAPRDVYSQAQCFLLRSWSVEKRWYIISISVGLSTLLVSTNGAMRRPLHRGTGDSLAPRFCVYMGMVNSFSGLQGSRQAAYAGQVSASVCPGKMKLSLWVIPLYSRSLKSCFAWRAVIVRKTVCC